MINDKTVLAITLARGGSRGISKKNIAPILGADNNMIKFL